MRWGGIRGGSIMSTADEEGGWRVDCVGLGFRNLWIYDEMW